MASFTALTVAMSLAGLDPERVHYVDHNAITNNFLFRGNSVFPLAPPRFLRSASLHLTVFS